MISKSRDGSTEIIPQGWDSRNEITLQDRKGRICS